MWGALGLPSCLRFSQEDAALPVDAHGAGCFFLFFLKFYLKNSTGRSYSTLPLTKRGLGRGKSFFILFVD